MTTEAKMTVERAGLEKVHDALMEAFEFLKYRDLMNARIHLAREVRFSPITSMVETELDRVKCWLVRERDRDELAAERKLLDYVKKERI